MNVLFQGIQCKQTIIRKSRKVLAPTTKEHCLEDIVLSIRYSIILNIDTQSNYSNPR